MVIINVDKPNDCEECIFSCFGIIKNWCFITKKCIPCKCPLIKIKNDLIDRDETLEALDNLAGYGLGIHEAIDYVSKANAAINGES